MGFVLRDWLVFNQMRVTTIFKIAEQMLDSVLIVNWQIDLLNRHLIVSLHTSLTLI